MKGFPQVVADIDFNRDSDIEKFGSGDRIVTLNCFSEENKEDKVGFSFLLGRKEDEAISLVFDVKELVQKLTQAMLAK